MRQRYRGVVERDEEGYFVAHVPERHAHTQAQSFEGLLQRLQEAIAVSEEKAEVVGLEGEREIEAA